MCGRSVSPGDRDPPHWDGRPSLHGVSGDPHPAPYRKRWPLGPQFLAAHAGDRRPIDEHYLTAWIAAHYLMFERRLLGSTELDSYCRALAAGADPERAFKDLVGRSATEFDRDLTTYVERLQQDGSLAAIR